MIENIMKHDIIKLRPEDTLIKALDIMNDNNINGAPVIDDNQELVGIIVKADIYRFLMEEGHYDTCPVDWAMTKKVISASKDEDITEIARRLRENDIVAIPILDGSNVIGIVSIENIIDYFIDINK
ncbi:CBS domain-containing protein [Clostridium thailandense]|uniref:CBS domain-containing protein n=1 Tax=Clostridium thailandense TaxID=2794346 RepID=A0A949U0W6_9CLOT|nr:CBS domain-containing protein [Clostridium thailandense]MBV7276323.1 CBS domain-containing protein [Clostridium thailandense]